MVPVDGSSYWSEEASFVLSDILYNKVCSGQMTTFNEAYSLPVINLYTRHYDQSSGQAIGSEADAISVNKELVERGVARWTDDTYYQY